MLVKTIEHGRKVFAHVRALWAKTDAPHRYLVIDTETRAVPPFPKEDALTVGRAEILVFSVCYQGASYCLPTSAFHFRYPDIADWAELLWPFFTERQSLMVAHNWNYDANVFWFDARLPVPRRIWDTMIGGWVSAEYQPKGLKDRAPQFGRFLRETKTVDFGNEAELAEYAEQDVVVAEELYQSQRFGKVTRPRKIWHVAPDGKFVATKNPFYKPPFEVEHQTISDFGRAWLTLVELPVLKATMRAERRGFPFDVDYLRSIRAKVLVDRQEHMKQMFRLAGATFNPNSGKDLAAVVERLGIEYPFVTKKGAPSFTEKNLKKVVELHPFFPALIGYKGLEKLQTVYIGSEEVNSTFDADCGLQRWLNPNTGAIHCSLGTVEAVTGRNSASRPNLQQIPSRRDTYGVRHCFSANPKGQKVIRRHCLAKTLIVLDYSQLELRVMALYCKDKAMSKVLCDPTGDIHQHTADEFGVKRDPEAKNLNFLLLYGGGAPLLASELTSFGAATDVPTAQSYVDRHKEVYPRVFQQRNEWCDEHEHNGRIVLLFGRTRTLPDADFSNKWTRHRVETQLANNAVQGAGQDFLKAAIVRADPRCINPDKQVLDQLEVKANHRNYLKDRVVEIERFRKLFIKGQCNFILQVHDEIIFTVAPSAAAECADALVQIMSWRHYLPFTAKYKTYNVPLVAEGGVGETWKAAKAKDCKIHVKGGYEHWQKYRE